jgi:hypothetical protein
VGASPAPLGVPMAPQGMAPIGAAMPYGGPATVREHTGIGFVFDHFNIPIPFPRLIAVPKPSEVTFHMPPTGVGFGAAPMMGMPMCMPMPQGMMAPAGYVAPQAPVGLTPQQQAALLQLLASQPTGTPAPAAPPVGATPPAAAAPTVVTDQQCDEIIEKCHILKRLHQLRQHACDSASCPK